MIVMTLITISAIYSHIFSRYDNPSPYACLYECSKCDPDTPSPYAGARLRFPECACYPITAEVNALI